MIHGNCNYIKRVFQHSVYDLENCDKRYSKPAKSVRLFSFRMEEIFMIQVVHAILLIVYIIVCVALTIVVLMQEGKQAGLTGAISGAAETYWGKNKGRSMEGGLVLATRILLALFLIISLLLNLKIFS